jgi:hypothetical protein
MPRCVVFLAETIQFLVENANGVETSLVPAVNLIECHGENASSDNESTLRPRRGTTISNCSSSD